MNDFDTVLKSGADKVSINSGAIRDPSLISAAAKRYGSQCVVLSMDVKRERKIACFYQWWHDRHRNRCRRMGKREDLGAGEIVLNSDADVYAEVLVSYAREIGGKVALPLIASGGAGKCKIFGAV